MAWVWLIWALVYSKSMGMGVVLAKARPYGLTTLRSLTGSSGGRSPRNHLLRCQTPKKPSRTPNALCRADRYENNGTSGLAWLGSFPHCSFFFANAQAQATYRTILNSCIWLTLKGEMLVICIEFWSLLSDLAQASPRYPGVQKNFRGRQHRLFSGSDR